MAACAGGVISGDNILLNHSLKVDGSEKDCLLCFLSAVARLILCAKSPEPLRAPGPHFAPLPPSNPCVKKTHPTHSGWRAWTSHQPLSPLFGEGVLSNATGPFGPARWRRPQSVSFKSIIGNEKDIYFSGCTPVKPSSAGKSLPPLLYHRLGFLADS